MKEEQLLKLKKDIENKKSEKSVKEGQLDYLMKQVEEDFGITSLEDLKVKIESLETEDEEIQKQIDKLVEELENELN